MAAAKWDSENTIKFVQEYKSHECLWNIKSSTYKNRNMRDAAISKIIEVMQIPGFGAPEVKNKIKNLRSTFAQERRKIELSKKSGTGTDNIYIPNIKWYKELESIYNYSDEKRTTLDNVSTLYLLLINFYSVYSIYHFILPRHCTIIIKIICIPISQFSCYSSRMICTDVVLYTWH